jgi:ubiquinone/menaquinone biosynthesis C-methylase UbiE
MIESGSEEVTLEPNVVEAYFDSVADDYETRRGAGWYQAHAELVLELAGPLRPPARILDIGCATGHLLRRAAALNSNCEGVGLDLSKQMIAVARKQASDLPNLRFIHHDWEQPQNTAQADWVQNGFDLVTCLSCAHYFTAMDEAFRRMRSMLRPGGRLLLVDRDSDGSPATLLFGFLHSFVLRDGVRFHGADHLVEMLCAAGFAHVRIEKRLRRLAWKGKLVTSLAVISAEVEPAPHTRVEPAQGQATGAR